MRVVALISWIVTALAGATLFGIWVPAAVRGGRNAPLPRRPPASRPRSSRLSTSSRCP